MIMIGRAGAIQRLAWRVGLAEAIGARVMTDRKTGAVFPTDHALHAAGPEAAELLAGGSVILSLDSISIAGTLKTACGGRSPSGEGNPDLSVDQYVHNGWSMDYQGLPPADVYLLAEPDSAVPPLLAAVTELRPPSGLY